MKLLGTIERKKSEFGERVLIARGKPFGERTLGEHLCGAVASAGSALSKLARILLKVMGFVVHLAAGVFLLSFRLFIVALLRR